MACSTNGEKGTDYGIMVGNRQEDIAIRVEKIKLYDRPSCLSFYLSEIYIARLDPRVSA
jgi:hypothetical protein